MTKKILVIDDEAADRKKIVTAMQKEGYAVVEASNAGEAIIRAQQTLPDLAIIDVVMPDSENTGFDICRKIKTTLQPNAPLVLMVTGNAHGVNVFLANQMGADGFEAKTSDLAHVIKAVQQMLSPDSH